MTEAQLAEIKEKFEGKWMIYQSEGFEDFLGELGVNIFIRQAANFVKSTSEIKVEGDQISISLDAGYFKRTNTFKLGEEMITEVMNSKSKITFTFEDGKIVSTNKPLDDTKPTKTTREIVGDDLIMTMYIGDVVCTRYSKRVS